MDTHRVYKRVFGVKLYFTGTYYDDGKEIDIIFDWSIHKDSAKLFTTTDAWDIFRIARHEFNMDVEVERIYDV